MAIPLTAEGAKAWKEACFAELAKFDQKNENPILFTLWSASAQYDLFHGWWKKRMKHIEKFSDDYWEERGYKINWESSSKELILEEVVSGA